MDDPYHSGERAVQQMTGERAKAILNARGIADGIPPGAVAFLARQQICALGWMSPSGEVWASMLAGREGFAQTEEKRRTLVLRIEDETNTLRATPPFADLREGDCLGALFIEPPARRRLRINGRAAGLSGERLIVAIDHAYANCPKYIQRRTLEPATDSDERRRRAIETGDALTAEQRAWIASADTVFVASAHPDGPVDASHRGGAPGFIQLQGDALRIPDYPGNSMFNTFGNFHLNARAGLVFVDFASNRQLKLTGRASLDLQAGETEGKTGGTGRWWTFEPERWIVAPLNLALRSDFVEASPFNP
jgi:hypothetical protein